MERTPDHVIATGAVGSDRGADARGGGRRHPAAAWTCAVVGVVLGTVTLGLTIGDGTTNPMFDTVVELGAFLGFTLLGAGLVLRLPRHPIGWLLAALGLAVLVQQTTQAYALRGLVAGGLPGWRGVGWISEWMITVPLVLFVATLLVFPSGAPDSRPTRALLWSVGVGGTALTVGWAVATWPQRGAGLLNDGATVPAALSFANGFLMASLPAAVVALVVRYRRAGDVERRQLQWLAVAAVGLVAALLAGMVASILDLKLRVIDALGVVSIAGIAAAMALAVLRYRLYDIDRILSRTVSYALLTALLATLYCLGVVVIGRVLDPVAPDSSLAVAASTLLVAGLFNPLRIRIQHTMARRFNRSRYEAERVLAAFRARLRGEVRLAALQRDLIETVTRTVQPAAVSVWLPSHVVGGTRANASRSIEQEHAT